MKRALRVLLLALIPITAEAEPFLVLGGEHENFTRIVIYADAGTSWTTSSSGLNYAITFDEHKDGFSADRVFDRLTKKRLVDLDSNRNTLTLRLPCDCSIEASQNENNLVILDIFDEKVARSKTPTLSLRLQAIERGASENSLRFPRKETLSAEPLNLPIVPVEKEPKQQRVESAQEQSSPEVLNELQSSLSQEVAKAASQGLLERQRLFFETALRREKIEAEGIATKQLEMDSPVEENMVPNLRITSSNDSGSIDDLNLGGESATCPSADSFDVSNWGGSGNFVLEMALSARGLYTADGVAVEEYIVNRVRSLIYFGFGQEARVLIREAGLEGEDLQTLVHLSEIVDPEGAPEAVLFKNNYHCDSVAALWSILETTNNIDGDDVNVNAVLREASALPLHLRYLLFERIKGALTALGKPEAASRLNEILERVEPFEKNEGQKEDEVVGPVEKPTNIDLAKKQLDSIINAIASDMAISIENATLLASYAHELRDSAMSAEYEAAYVIALAHASEFETALEELDRISEKSEVDDSRILSHIFKRLSSAGSDADFLELTFAELIDNKRKVSPDVQARIADRLNGLGFSEQALDLFSTADSLEVSSDVAEPATPEGVQKSLEELRAWDEQNMSSAQKDNALSILEEGLAESKSARAQIEQLLNSEELKIP